MQISGTNPVVLTNFRQNHKNTGPNLKATKYPIFINPHSIAASYHLAITAGVVDEKVSQGVDRVVVKAVF
jgi:hypothetical protein